MPQATDIVIKNGAATPVDKTFSLSVPASGNTAALWQLREGANPGVYPKIQMSSRNGNGQPGRKVQGTITVPLSVTSSSGAVTSAGAFIFDFTATVPDLVPDTLRDDAIAFAGNLLQHSLTKAVLKTGFAPT